MAQTCRKELPFFQHCPTKPPDVGGVGKETGWKRSIYLLLAIYVDAVVDLFTY
jgi:hypothetical protein